MDNEESNQAPRFLTQETGSISIALQLLKGVTQLCSVVGECQSEEIPSCHHSARDDR